MQKTVNERFSAAQLIDTATQFNLKATERENFAPPEGTLERSIYDEGTMQIHPSHQNGANLTALVAFSSVSAELMEQAHRLRKVRSDLQKAESVKLLKDLTQLHTRLGSHLGVTLAAERQFSGDTFKSKKTLTQNNAEIQQQDDDDGDDLYA